MQKEEEEDCEVICQCFHPHAECQKISEITLIKISICISPGNWT